MLVKMGEIVQFSCSVVSDSLRFHGLQHARPPCPSPTPRVYSNSCPLNPWCNPTISSSVVPFSSHLQPFPAPGSFLMSQFFTSGGQSIGVSAEASVQFSSVAQSCPTLCDPMNRSMPGHHVHHQLPEFTQTHVHWVSNAIQPSHPLSSPSPPVPNPSQHQGLLKWVSSLHQVAKVLEFQLQYQSFWWTPRTDLLYNGLVGSPCTPRDSQESSPTPQFKASILLWSAFFIVQLSHPYMITGKTIALTRWNLSAK